MFTTSSALIFFLCANLASAQYTRRRKNIGRLIGEIIAVIFVILLFVCFMIFRRRRRNRAAANAVGVPATGTGTGINTGPKPFYGPGGHQPAPVNTGYYGGGVAAPPPAYGGYPTNAPGV